MTKKNQQRIQKKMRKNQLKKRNQKKQQRSQHQKKKKKKQNQKKQQRRQNQKMKKKKKKKQKNQKKLKRKTQKKKNQKKKLMMKKKIQKKKKLKKLAKGDEEEPEEEEEPAEEEEEEDDTPKEWLYESKDLFVNIDYKIYSIIGLILAAFGIFFWIGIWSNRRSYYEENKISFFTSKVAMWVMHIMGICLALTLIAFGIHYLVLKADVQAITGFGITGSVIIGLFISAIAYIVIIFISYLLRVLNNYSPCEVPHQ
eukprot:TRINITY_DN104_c0_g1_i2.p1 TRINITY_DN104_c0_g1~~TRINITY_DN104_c0_g1_i2.p1  ORF type:complete len:255 (-),score=82.66 TRINITY_DN104_c0_g1_i2:104-868(-)